MKKLVLMLTAIFTMAFTSLCMAADGNDLNKQQAAAETFMKAFSAQAPAFTQFSKDFDASLKTKMNDKTYKALQDQVKEKFGKMGEVKFYSFQRFDKADQVTYIASFSKEKMVAVTLVFNKNSKMINFVLSPIKADAKASK